MRTISLLTLTLSLVACADGADGKTGAAGPAGATGTDGAAGATGMPGTDGQDGADGADGATGASGEAGADGADVLVTHAPAEICDGTTVSWGLDDDGDGTLDADEVDGSQDLCDGTDGTDGANGQDGTSSIVARLNGLSGWTGCETGTADVLAWGLDDNGNGTLEQGEVDGGHLLVCGPPTITWNTRLWLTPGSPGTPSVGTRQSYICPDGTGTARASIYGTGTYTSDSGICTAAVHAGIITLTGGTVTVEVAPGASSYTGSTANGVTSSAWSDFALSFVFWTP